MIWTSALLALLPLAHAYQIVVSSEDVNRQVCSGMYATGGSRDPEINVVFGPASTGSVALVIYEWQDAKLLGIDSDGTGAGQNEWEDQRIYVCTLAAMRANLCQEESLGRFIVSGGSANESSIWTTSVRFDIAAYEDTNLPQGSQGPFNYPVTKTGYYCVGIVPVAFAQPQNEIPEDEGQANEGLGQSMYSGVVDFENVFVGHLPAAEYPKIWFYFILGFVYLLLGTGWAALCYRHRQDLIPLQNYVSGLLGILTVEMFAIYAYYNYLNNYGARGMANFLLVVVSVLNAARNSISFFLLCIVCMGLGVVRPSLGSLMLRVRILAFVHFVFGIVYSVGTVTVPLESAGYFILFMILPLAFTLSAFMMWIMWSLNATIQDLELRKQTYKKQMFLKLYRILLAAIIVILGFFVVSSISFSNRLDEDYAPDTWKTRWWLLDGWLSILYMTVFAAIAFLWRPTGNNTRLAMSDELATDENEAEDFEIDDLEDGRRKRDNEVGEDGVVFDIGDEGSDDEAKGKKGYDNTDDETLRGNSMDSPPGYKRVV